MISARDPARLRAMRELDQRSKASTVPGADGQETLDVGYPSAPVPHAFTQRLIDLLEDERVQDGLSTVPLTINSFQVEAEREDEKDPTLVSAKERRRSSIYGGDLGIEILNSEDTKKTKRLSEQRLRSEITRMEAAIPSLTKHIASLERELREDRRSFTSQRKELENRTRQLSDEIETHRSLVKKDARLQNLHELKSQVDDRIEQIFSLYAAGNASSLTAMAAGFRSELDRLDTEISEERARDPIRVLKQELVQFEGDKENLLRAGQQLESMQTVVRDLKRRRTLMQKRIAVNQSERDTLRQAAEQMERRNARIALQIKEIKSGSHIPETDDFLDAGSQMDFYDDDEYAFKIGDSDEEPDVLAATRIERQYHPRTPAERKLIDGETTQAVNLNLRRMLRAESKKLTQCRHEIAEFIRERSELEQLLRDSISDVKVDILQAAGADPQLIEDAARSLDGADAGLAESLLILGEEDREQVLRKLLARGRVLSLLSDELFAPGVGVYGQARFDADGMPAKVSLPNVAAVLPINTTRDVAIEHTHASVPSPRLSTTSRTARGSRTPRTPRTSAKSLKRRDPTPAAVSSSLGAILHATEPRERPEEQVLDLASLGARIHTSRTALSMSLPL